MADPVVQQVENRFDWVNNLKLGLQAVIASGILTVVAQNFSRPATPPVPDQVIVAEPKLSEVEKRLNLRLDAIEKKL